MKERDKMVLEKFFFFYYFLKFFTLFGDWKILKKMKEYTACIGRARLLFFGANFMFVNP